MKRVLTALSLLLVVFALSACGTSDKDNNGSNNGGKKGYELALITDIGTIDDKSFNQGAWEGLSKYAEENNITYKYYQPAEKATDAYINSIDLAVEGGAKLVVCPGYLFENAVYQVQDKYPDVKFIILDGQPRSEDGTDLSISDNVYAIYYSEEQAGFLAGYAAVKDGYKKLGFMGGVAVPAVIRFGYGFVQGAEYAAKELGIDNIEMKYHYANTFSATPEVQSMAASWYNQGTEVIFACGGAVGNSVMTAAEAANKKVIGVDVDQSTESETVITSAMKQLSVSVYDGITAFYNDAFPGGEILTLGATSDAVGLPLETSKFNTFSQADYDAIYAKIVSGEVTPYTHEKATDVSELTFDHVVVESVK